jgi:hypothetical protein
VFPEELAEQEYERKGRGIPKAFIHEPVFLTWEQFVSQAEALIDGESLRLHLKTFLINCEDAREKCLRRDLLRPVLDHLHRLSRSEVVAEIKKAASLKDRPDFRTSEERIAELRNLSQDFNREIRRASSREQVHEIARRYDAIVKSRELDLVQNTKFEDIVWLEAEEMFPVDENLPRFRRPDRPSIPVATYKPDEKREEGESWTIIPMETLAARYKTKKRLTPRKNEIVKFDDRQTYINIPDTFPFDFYQEAAFHGLLTLAMKGQSDWASKADDRKLHVDIGDMKEFYEAVGLRLKPNRHYQSENQLKRAFVDLMSYEHPFVLSRKAGTDGDGNEISEILAGFRHLFKPVFYQKSRPGKFRVPTLKPKEGGGWVLDAELRNMRVYFSPFIFPVKKLKHFRQVPSNIYKQVEEASQKLSHAEGKKRPWKQEAVFLSFVQYLLGQGGKYSQLSDGKRVYFMEREQGRLIRQLGLADRFKDDRRGTMKILRRTIKIYRELGFLYGWRWDEGKKGRKLILLQNLEKLPHLNHAASRFFRTS